MGQPKHRNDVAHVGPVPVDQLAAGTPTEGFVPAIVGGVPTWGAAGGGASDLDSVLALSTGQDVAGALTGAAAPSSSNPFATMADTGGAAGMTNPMTTQDDIIVQGASAPARLGKGTDGQVLTVDPTTHHLVWATPSSSGVADILDLPTAETDTSLVLGPNGVGGVEFRAETGGGGGGSDLVQVASGAGSIRIPGLAGSPDAVPGSPSAYDEEFDAALSGWTMLGSPGTFDTSSVKSHLHLAVSAPGAFQVHGGYKACPSFPFTVTARLTDYRNDANYQHHALMLTDSTPTKLFTWGPVFQSSEGTPEMIALNWNSRTSRGPGMEYPGTRQLPGYIAMVVNSSTSVDLWFSLRGLVWVQQAAAWNPGFTVANVGIAVTGNDGDVACDMVVDWLRFV